jgi:hypothetical protein
MLGPPWNNRFPGLQHRANPFKHQMSRKLVSGGVPVPLSHLGILKSMQEHTMLLSING